MIWALPATKSRMGEAGERHLVSHYPSRISAPATVNPFNGRLPGLFRHLFDAGRKLFQP